jgi:uncharacterized protein
MTSSQILVLAKAPVAGRVKTRLCPPCTPAQAAAVAAAALADTLETVGASSAVRRILALEGAYLMPPGWEVLSQRGSTLGDRLANAFADVHRPGAPTLLIGMDTPQVSARELDAAFGCLAAPGGPDAVLGPAVDGGWWALGLRDSRHAEVLRDIETSTSRTGEETFAALQRRGLRVGRLGTLTDVDEAPDAVAVAALCPAGARFPAAVAAHVPLPAREESRPRLVTARAAEAGR